MPDKHDCKELATLPGLMTIAKPLPQELLNHARKHEPCLLKMSFALAIQKVCSTTTPRVARDENCPPQDYIFELLAIALRTLPKSPISPNEDIAQDIHIAFDELDFVADIREHLNDCRFCRDYYRKLYETAFIYQKKYAEAMKNGSEIIPHVKIDVDEINAEEIGYNPYDTTHKPN